MAFLAARDRPAKARSGGAVNTGCPLLVARVVRRWPGYLTNFLLRTPIHAL